jgi:hypothetical protein
MSSVSIENCEPIVFASFWKWPYQLWYLLSDCTWMWWWMCNENIFSISRCSTLATSCRNDDFRIAALKVGPLGVEKVNICSPADKITKLQLKNHCCFCDPKMRRLNVCGLFIHWHRMLYITLLQGLLFIHRNPDNQQLQCLAESVTVK